MADTDATVAAATDPPPTPPAKKSKLIVIIVCAVVALGLAGGGAYFLFAKDDADASSEPGKEASSKSDKSGKSAKSKDKAPKAPAIYVKFEPPFVVNFEAKGMMRFLQVSVEILTRDQATADLIAQHSPVLRNDLLMLFGNQTYETISTRDGKERLRGDALKTVAKVIAVENGNAKNVEQLYFTSFVMQ